MSCHRVLHYLLIECIIENLVQDGIIDPPSGYWKKTALNTQYYFADFYRATTGSVIPFRISVIEGNHVITSTAFLNQAKFFNVDPAKILERCKM